MLLNVWRATVQDLKRLGMMVLELAAYAIAIVVPTILGLYLSQSFGAIVTGIVLVVFIAIEAVIISFWINYKKARREMKENKRKMLANTKPRVWL